MLTLNHGDLSLHYQLRRSNALLKSQMRQASAELASGQKSDLTSATAGDFSPLASIERNLTRAEAFKAAAVEADLLARTAQAALTSIQKDMSTRGVTLSTVKTMGQNNITQSLSKDARAMLDSAVAALNSRVGGRSVFSGMATDTTALSSPQTMLDSVLTATSGLTTAADVIAEIDAWLSPSGDFETNHYHASETPLAVFKLSESRTARYETTARDPELKEALKGLIMGALVDAGWSGSPGETSKLVALAGEQMIQSSQGLVTLMAGIGSAQANIAEAQAEVSSQVSALKIARSELTSIDPYEVASSLQEVQTRLESMYAVTSRLAGLSLTDYMR